MAQGATSNVAIGRMLDQLSTDRDYREQMLGDPVAAFKAHGIEMDPANVPAVRSLPSMDEIAKIRDDFKADPMGRSCIAVFMVVGAK